MKKTILFIVLALLPLMGCAGAHVSSGHAPTSAEPGAGIRKDSHTDELLSLVRQFSLDPGVEVVKVGPFGTSMIRGLMKRAMSDADEEELAVLELVRGIRKIAIVDYSECEESVKSRFSAKLDKVLGKENLLVDIKDDGEDLKIFGLVSEDGSMVKDFVLHTSSENALICLFGTIPIDKLMDKLQ